MANFLITVYVRNWMFDSFELTPTIVKHTNIPKEYLVTAARTNEFVMYKIGREKYMEIRDQLTNILNRLMDTGYVQKFEIKSI